jgi:hypothetical protein
MPDSIDQAGFVVVGGASSAESRILQRVLGLHPEIAAGHEFPHLCDLVELRRRMHQSIDRGWIDLICSYEDVDARLRDFLEGLLVPTASQPGGRRLIDGTAASASVFPELAQMLSEARFIHVVQDPRASVAAALRAGDRSARRFWDVPGRWKDLRAAIRRVEAALEGGFRAAREVQDRVLTVSSRDLSSDPEPAIRRLCSFLEIDWDDSMSQSGVVEPRGSERFDDTWTTELSAGAQVAISRAFRASRELAELGYLERLARSLRRRLRSGARRKWRS